VQFFNWYSLSTGAVHNWCSCQLVQFINWCSCQLVQFINWCTSSTGAVLNWCSSFLKVQFFDWCDIFALAQLTGLPSLCLFLTGAKLLLKNNFHEKVY
jgi:hypothetical protein